MLRPPPISRFVFDFGYIKFGAEMNLVKECSARARIQMIGFPPSFSISI